MNSDLPELNFDDLPELSFNQPENKKPFTVNDLLLQGATAYGAYKGGQAIKQKLTPTPQQRLTKATKLTTEILQPPSTELSRFFGKETMPAVRETMKVIKPVKTYGELYGLIDNETKSIFNERNNLLKDNNYQVGDYTKNLSDFIKEQKQKKLMSPSEVSQMEEVLNQEKSYLKKNKLDRLSAQARKEDLQDLTEKLLKKSSKGEVIDTQPAKTLARDRLRFALKEAVEGKDTTISEINGRYEGLRDAKRFIQRQGANVEKALPESLVGKVASFLSRSPRSAVGEALARSSQLQQRLPSKTAKISKLIKSANNEMGMIPKIGGRVLSVAPIASAFLQTLDPAYKNKNWIEQMYDLGGVPYTKPEDLVA